MTLDIHPLALALLVGAPAVSALAGAALAARWMRRPADKTRADPVPDLESSSQAHLDASAQVMVHLKAMLRSQDALHAEVLQCREALARLDRQLLAGRAAVAHVREPLPDAPKEAQQVAPPSVKPPRAAQAVPPPSRSPSPPSPRPPSSPPAAVLQPLPRPQSVDLAAAPEVELTDDEIDALPPELPAPALPRKRVLPPPRKPTLNRL